MIINKQNLDLLEKGFKAAFMSGFMGVDTYWQRIATLVPSSVGQEKYGWLGQFPRLREWLGDRHIKSLALHDYAIKNKKFESTVEVGVEDIERDNLGVYSPLFKEMGFAAQTHPDELIFALLLNGFAEPCYDDQYFFDTDHPVGGQSVSNMQAGSSPPWFLLDVRRPLKPLIFQREKDYMFRSITAPESEHVFMRDKYLYGVDARVNAGFGFWQQAFGSKAALNDANFDLGYAAMASFKSDEGRPLGTKPSLLVTGPANRSTANEVVKAERRADGATNTNRDAVDVLIVEWL